MRDLHLQAELLILGDFSLQQTILFQNELASLQHAGLSTSVETCKDNEIPTS